MGEMIDGGENPQKEIARDHSVTGEPGKIKTDVLDVFADGERNGMPVFDVSPEEFNVNMSGNRRRLRFKSGTPAQNYMRGTRYNIPFWIRNTKDGYVRKIK